MKTWNELDGYTLFNRVFTKPIKISTIKLFQITIDNNRPNITFEFDIPEIPDSAPEKWIKMGFNTCRIGLSRSQGITLKKHTYSREPHYQNRED
jgi:hypothetical protein